MRLRESGIATLYLSLLERYALPVLLRRSWSPNRLTLWGAGLSLTVPLGFWLHPFAGAAAMALSGICDSLDGLLARRTDSGGRFGAFLDSTMDRISDGFFLAGFWVLFLKNGIGGAAAGFGILLAFLLTVLVSYTKARIEGLGAVCRSEGFGREARTLFLLVWATIAGLLPGSAAVVLWGGLTFYITLCGLTVAQRFRIAWERLSG